MDSCPFGKMRFSVFFVVLWSLAEGMHLVIEPESIKQLHPRDVHVSCQPLNLKASPLYILLIAIRRQGQMTALASVYKNSATPANNNNQMQRSKVEGHVDDTFIENSFLNLTMFNQTLNAAGYYECQVDYMDFSGNLKTDKKAIELKVEKPSLDALETQIEKLTHRMEVLEKGKQNYQKQSTDSLKQVSFLKEKLKNQTEDSDEKINDLKNLLEKRVKSSDYNVLKLEHELEDQENQTKVTEETVLALISLIKNQTESNSQKVAELQNIMKVQQSYTKVDEKQHKDILAWLKNAEKINEDQDIKIGTLSQNDLKLGRELKNEQNQIMNINVTGMVSKIDMKKMTEDLTTIMKSTDNKIENEVKSLESKHDVDKKMLLKQLTNFATNSQLKLLADKEANDVINMKQNDDKIIAAEKIVKQKINKQLKNLQDADANNGKLITDLKTDLTKKAKLVSTRLTALEAFKSVFDTQIKSLTAAEASLAEQLKSLSASETKQYADMTSYVDTSIAKKHPEPSCGLFTGKALANCKNKAMNLG